MQKLNRASLMSLEEYALKRPVFRSRIIAHKKPRQVSLGAHATLYFEDYLSMQYQVQEMLRVEKIFEAAAIEEEIQAYNPLIPDGANWKATLMLEYPDVEERRTALAALRDVEHHIWVSIDNLDRSFAVANEDMERTSDEKTAAVHFLRFELTADAIACLKAGSARVTMGVGHPAMQVQCDLDRQTIDSLTNDLT
ncbi:MAG: DUF3501 family protein [Proteobacteria bacterium]|nr:DUF3501 family protein [Pseudomonadota bacterium]